jgi:hypothetical protein
MLVNITHELIGPQTTNILLQTWGLTMSQEVLIFLTIGPKVFLPPTPSLKWVLSTLVPIVININ